MLDRAPAGQWPRAISSKPAPSKSAHRAWTRGHRQTEPACDVLGIGGRVVRDPAEDDHVEVAQLHSARAVHHADMSRRRAISVN
jgi:hypothetical protein